MSGDTQLSNDELRLIFRHLPVSDFRRCMLVSKQWKNALLEEDGADEENLRMASQVRGTLVEFLEKPLQLLGVLPWHGSK